LVAITVAVPYRDVGAAALVDVTWAVADATSIKRANAFVHVVANAIGIRVLGAIATTDAQGVKLVAVTVAIPFWDRSASTGKHSSWPIANAAGVKFANAFVHIVANAIGIRVIFTRTSALTKGVFLVAITVAVPYRDVGAAALVDVTWAVANATAIQCANAFVHIVANAIGICIGGASTTTNAQSIIVEARTILRIGSLFVVAGHRI
jgi:hypothetical protein